MIEAIIMMLVVGAVLGAALGVANKVFYVATDTRVEDVTAMLPGYNCGGCGYPGCSGLAQALVDGEADVVDCKPSKQEARDQIKEYLAK
ncbi:RnfABCDGE type electron transport complex subunit B [Anaerorhabdus furcosa]|uniref:Electron transport complex protein RnfB n=1 Tax=Anaerorhabdus furcosa TaxID=118967 RepID=A0A1T4PUD0_9FIRM|nr:RnfABCDGE type electron transport complex subunit B [Anaerorhabdus furcosa]SJZ95164.1 electron transport complex protein RnfB [Anaerorhabdus furcosa]